MSGFHRGNTSKLDQTQSILVVQTGPRNSCTGDNSALLSEPTANGFYSDSTFGRKVFGHSRRVGIEK